MRVLVIGSGAREHALVARLAGERDVAELVCAPGNPGIAAIARIAPVDISQPDALAALAERERIDMTVVGPELPLSLGVVDRFAEENRLIFGPTARAARLESSKAFAKAFMARHGVPTARFRTCDTADEALACVRSGEFDFPVVLKADGLAAGKGVVIAANRAEAESAVAAAMTARCFGEAGARLVVEECLAGPEVSFFVVSDGDRALPIGSAQDHKRVFDDDQGPNTGGMGAFAPSPLVDEPLQTRVMHEIVEPVVSGMAAEGHPFRGVLYVGLMLTAAGPKVIEFNVRFGDPEAQVILPRIAEPLLPLLVAAAMGSLHQRTCRLSSEKVVGIVLASRGYPESPESGRPIFGIDEAERLAAVTVYHGGTARRNNQLVTAGGRVLTVVGRGGEFADAIARAYSGSTHISFEGMQYRRDIGRKALIVDRRSGGRQST
jgi:phosphoribosylamine--glycine ligase